jgi:hypothetical protein
MNYWNCVEFNVRIAFRHSYKMCMKCCFMGGDDAEVWGYLEQIKLRDLHLSSKFFITIK